MDSAGIPEEGKLPGVRRLKVTLWILIVLTIAVFIVRGPMRFLQNSTSWNDLSQNYAASKLWLKGQSPSDPKNFIALWKHETGSRLELTDIRTHLAPPLGGLVVMAPIAALPWRFAKVLWVAVLFVAFGATVGSLAIAGGFGWNETRTLAFVIACLVLAPFQTGIASGNPSILVIGFCAVAIWAAQRHSDVSAGVLFGMACSMKPHLGAFLVLYYLIRRRWQLFGTALGTTAALNLMAVLYLQLRGASWIRDYLGNAKGFVAANPIDDFSTINPSRFTLINLQVPFFSITGNSSQSNLLAFAVGALLLCAWLYWATKRSAQNEALLSLGAVSALSLLPVYHRFYDAALLVVPLCWGMTSGIVKQKTVAILAFLLLAPFLVPGTAVLQQLAVLGRVPEAITRSWWWNCVVMPHETWAILLLCLLLLYAMKVEVRRSQKDLIPD
jgi:hypothetical protein